MGQPQSRLRRGHSGGWYPEHGCTGFAWRRCCQRRSNKTPAGSLSHLRCGSCSRDLSFRAVAQHFSDCPALMTAHWSGFHDADPVTDATGVVFVVSLVTGGPANRLLVDGMGEAAFNRNHHCFLHLVADDGADPFLDCHWYGGGVQEAVERWRSDCTISSWASLMRTSLKRCVLVSWRVACWKRS